jgi:hypothetical protein
MQQPSRRGCVGDVAEANRPRGGPETISRDHSPTTLTTCSTQAKAELTLTALAAVCLLVGG